MSTNVNYQLNKIPFKEKFSIDTHVTTGDIIKAINDNLSHKIEGYMGAKAAATRNSLTVQIAISCASSLITKSDYSNILRKKIEFALTDSLKDVLKPYINFNYPVETKIVEDRRDRSKFMIIQLNSQMVIQNLIDLGENGDQFEVTVCGATPIGKNGENSFLKIKKTRRRKEKYFDNGKGSKPADATEVYKKDKGLKQHI